MKSFAKSNIPIQISPDEKVFFQIRGTDIIVYAMQSGKIIATLADRFARLHACAIHPRTGNLFTAGKEKLIFVYDGKSNYNVQYNSKNNDRKLIACNKPMSKEEKRFFSRSFNSEIYNIQCEKDDVDTLSD